MSESLPCLNCGKAATQLCARCRVVAFCNKACQRSAWERHKVLCAPFGTALVVKKEFAIKSGATLPGAPIAITGALSFGRIVALLRDNLGDAAFIARGMKVLYLKIDGASDARSALDAGAMAPVAAALRIYGTSAWVWAPAGGVLNNLTLSDAGIEAALDATVVPSVVLALRTHLADAAVCQAASGALSHISDSPAGKEAVLAAHAIVPLLHALRAHILDVKVCISVCGAMTCFKSGPGLDEALAEDALLLITSALQINSKAAASNLSSMVCNSACAFLAAVSARPGGGDDVVAAGALQPLIAALRVYPKDERVCYNANEALWNVALIGGQLSAVLAAGAVPLLVDSLRNHVADKINCEQGLFFLVKLALVSVEGKRAVAGAGAAAPLIEALRIHAREGSDVVVWLACRGLRFICDGDDDSSIAVRATPAVVEAFGAHFASERVCEHAAAILSCSFSVQAGVDAATAAGGVGQIARFLASALQTHTESANVSTIICSAFANLACFDAGRAAARASEALVALWDTLRKHIGYATICKVACIAINNLLASSSKEMLVQVSCNTPLLIAVLREHIDIVDACEAAANILAKLAFCEETEGTVVTAGAEKALNAVADRHSLSAYPSFVYGCLKQLQSKAQVHQTLR